MELSNYQAFMECMRKWEKIGCNILCGLALWEQMQDCDRRGVPYTDIDIEAVSQDVVYRLMMSHDRLYALALYEWTEQHFAQNSDTSDGVGLTSWRAMARTTPVPMLMYGKEASNRKQEIDRQHYTIPNQRPKDKHCGKI